MLANKSAMATVAVKSLDTAKRFYGGVLGLPIADADAHGGGWVAFKTGDTRLFAYVSPYAGTNQGTSVTWTLGRDFDAVVDALRAKGVVFEHYDLPNTTLQGDVHVSGEMRVAWFKDPDGNILNIGNG